MNKYIELLVKVISVLTGVDENTVHHDSHSKYEIELGPLKKNVVVNLGEAEVTGIFNYRAGKWRLEQVYLLDYNTSTTGYLDRAGLLNLPVELDIGIKAPTVADLDAGMRRVEDLMDKYRGSALKEIARINRLLGHTNQKLADTLPNRG